MSQAEEVLEPRAHDATTVALGRIVVAPSECLLRDGSVAVVRQVRRGDREELHALHENAEPVDRRLRFLSSSPVEARRYADHLVDGTDHLALVLTSRGRILGVASAERPVGLSYPDPTDGRTAEIALMVADHQHRGGIGTLLLEHLAAEARAAGLEHLQADVLAGNHLMLEVLARSGLTTTRRAYEAGLVTVSIDLTLTTAFERATASRTRDAVAASLAPLLRPRSVVVVGPSSAEDRTDDASRLPDAVRSGGFTGPCHLVRRGTAPALNGPGPDTHPASLVPVATDLAILALPTADVIDAIHACGSAGARVVLVLPRATGDEQARDQMTVAHSYGMRLVGPGSLGVASTELGTRLDALTVARPPFRPHHGSGLGLGVQGSAAGAAVLAGAARRGLPVQQFLSLGTAVDVDATDLLRTWQEDAGIRVIGLALEAPPDLATFFRVAADVCPTKPVVLLSGGGTSASSAERSGVVLAGTTEDFLDLLAAKSDETLA